MKFNHLKSRRDFIRTGCRTLSTIGAAAAFGQAGLVNANAQTTGGYKALVCIFLFGGNDANNMLVPNDTASYKMYGDIRGALAIPQKSLLSIHDPASGANFGLHPSMTGLAGLFNDAKAPRLALAANVGTLIKQVPHDPVTKKPNLNAVPLPVNLYSHSDQQTEWQNAGPMGGVTTGWEGRLADKITSLNSNQQFPASIGISGNSLQLIGQNTLPTTISTNNFGLVTGPTDPRTVALQQMLNLKSGVSLIQAGSNSLNTALDVAKLVDYAVNHGTPIQSVFPQTDIGNQLSQVAKIIQVRASLGVQRQIFFCSMGGFDTHSDQLRQHAQLMGDLSAALTAFDTAMGQLGEQQNVTAFTESEFSRTFQPNGNAGTDHAWGSHTLIMGGAVKGGRIYGTFPTLALQGPDDSGNRGNWVPTTSTDQYGAALAKWFGLQSSSDLDYVFPNLHSFNYQALGFLG